MFEEVLLKKKFFFSKMYVLRISFFKKTVFKKKYLLKQVFCLRDIPSERSCSFPLKTVFVKTNFTWFIFKRILFQKCSFNKVILCRRLLLLLLSFYDSKLFSKMVAHLFCFYFSLFKNFSK